MKKESKTIDLIGGLIEDIRYQLLYSKNTTPEVLKKISTEDFKLALELGFINSIILIASDKANSIMGKTLVEKLDTCKTMLEKMEAISAASEVDPVLANRLSQAIFSYYLVQCDNLNIEPNKTFVAALALATN